MKNVVVLGDKTSHGGTVISASSSFDIGGKNAALLTDSVSCPEHGTNPLVECVMEFHKCPAHDTGRIFVVFRENTRNNIYKIKRLARVRQAINLT